MPLKVFHRRVDHIIQYLLTGRLVTLVGLISKNGILIVQFANELQRKGRGKVAAVQRLRAFVYGRS